jgi:hypothetical protein
MTPQKIDIREERRERENRVSTAELAAPNGKPVQEPNLPLFAQNDTLDFRSRWEKIQIGFVDEPRKAVEQADELVACAIKRLADVFAAERNKLEGEWDKSDNVSTEDLRVALRRYRSFFDRVLSV